MIRRATRLGFVTFGAIAFVGSLFVVGAWSRYPTPREFGPNAGQYAVEYLRCRLEGNACETITVQNELTQAGTHTVFGTVYDEGRREAPCRGEGETAMAALAHVGDCLVTQLSEPGDVPSFGIRVDFVTARGPVLESVPLLLSLSVVPGLDGMGLERDGQTAWLLPYELSERGLLTSAKPFAFMDLHVGLDLELVRSLLNEAWDTSGDEGTLFRFTTESYLETETETVTLYRSSPPAPEVTRQNIEQAIVDAADWVVRAERDDGRFHYMYTPLNDEFLDPSYSLGRHAGTTLFLLQTYDYTGEPNYLDTAERALQYLWDLTLQSCGQNDVACVATETEARLGHSAIAVAAFVEHHLVTGQPESLERARALGRFLVMMQKPDGDFYHRYHLTDGINREAQSFYYTGEAVFALARLATVDPDESAWRDSVRQTLDFWIGDYWSHFSGGFYFVEEHWTCLAIEAAHDLFLDDRYDQFCFDIAHFYARLIHDENSSPFLDFPGGIGFGVFFPPHTTPTAARTEAIVAAYRISVARGEPDLELAAAIRSTYGFMLAAQYGESHNPLFPNPDRANGGFRESPLVPLVRIDYNQHAGSAFIRGVRLLFSD